MIILDVKSISKSFGGVKAVTDCSFQALQGSITALIGPNGSGKTTVFNLISGILKPDKGSIIFNQIEITNLQPHLIARLGISRSFQQVQLFENLTLEQNLTLVFYSNDNKVIRNLFFPQKLSKEKIERALELLSLFGLEKIFLTPIRELSYGQRKLVELIRAIVAPHRLILLDEPVAGVVPGLKNKIQHILFELRQTGETILLIEHDMNFTFSIADRVIVLDKGKVIAEGSPDLIRNNPEVLAAYLGTQ